MSSVAGEILAADAGLQVVEEHCPPEIYRGKTLVILGDGQAAFAAILKMASKNPKVLKYLLIFWARALRMGVDLDVIWIPREENKLADANSKREDPSAWELARRAYRILINHFRVRAGKTPSLDVFADNFNKKCKLFISRWPCPGAVRWGAFRQGAFIARDENGKRRLVYMNPPFELMAWVIRLIADYKIDVVLVYPAWPRPWATELKKTLPVVMGPVAVSGAEPLCIPGRRVVKKDYGTVRYALEAVLIMWEEE